MSTTSLFSLTPRMLTPRFPPAEERRPPARGVYLWALRLHAVTAGFAHRRSRRTAQEPSDEVVMATAQRRPDFVRLTAAGAAWRAASGGHLAFRTLLDLERVTASTGRAHVRVVDREAALEPFDEVDLRALQIRRAERVDDDGDPERVDPMVAFLLAGVEAERVLEAQATAALNRDAEHFRLAGGLLGHQLADLRRGALGEADQGFLFDRRHRSHGSNEPDGSIPLAGRVCNSRYPHR